MIRKYCPLCKQYSYSASSLHPWICAVCNNDLSAKPVLQIDETDQEDISQQESDPQGQAVRYLDFCK